MKFIYTKNIDSQEPIMLINKQIGSDDDGEGIVGSIFQEELLALDQMGKKRIQIWINSVGGIVMDGYSICNAILKSNTRVDTYCLGMAASIAAVIFQTGRKRYMADYGILMYHEPYTENGTVYDNPLLSNMNDSLVKIVSNRSKMSVSDVNAMFQRTTFIQADEALKMGLCDEIENTVTLNTKNLPKNNPQAYLKEVNTVLNKYLNKKQMTKVTNKLNLNEDANEDSIVKAIDEVVNKSVEEAVLNANKKSGDDLDAAKKEVEDLKQKLKEAEDAFKKAKADLDDADDKINKMVDAEKEEKAKALIAENVKAGKIKNEPTSITEWIAKAKLDMKGTAIMLESIPTNKPAEKFELNVEKKPEANSVAVAMAKIQNKMEKK